MKGTNHDVSQVMMNVLGRVEVQTVITYAYSTKLFGAEAIVCRPGAKCCSVTATHTHHNVKLTASHRRSNWHRQCGLQILQAHQ